MHVGSKPFSQQHSLHSNPHPGYEDELLNPKPLNHKNPTLRSQFKGDILRRGLPGSLLTAAAGSQRQNIYDYRLQLHLPARSCCGAAFQVFRNIEPAGTLKQKYGLLGLISRPRAAKS